MNDNIKSLINEAGAMVKEDGILFNTLDVLKLTQNTIKAAAQICVDNGDQDSATAILEYFGLNS